MEESMEDYIIRIVKESGKQGMSYTRNQNTTEYEISAYQIEDMVQKQFPTEKSTRIFNKIAQVMYNLEKDNV